jgi:hypothetical protein
MNNKKKIKKIIHSRMYSRKNEKEMLLTSHDKVD